MLLKNMADADARIARHIVDAKLGPVQFLAMDLENCRAARRTEALAFRRDMTQFKTQTVRLC